MSHPIPKHMLNDQELTQHLMMCKSELAELTFKKINIVLNNYAKWDAEDKAECDKKLKEFFKDLVSLGMALSVLVIRDASYNQVEAMQRLQELANQCKEQTTPN